MPETPPASVEKGKQSNSKKEPTLQKNRATSADTQPNPNRCTIAKKPLEKKCRAQFMQ
jgi:hypothetical protein